MPAKKGEPVGALAIAKQFLLAKPVIADWKIIHLSECSFNRLACVASALSDAEAQTSTTLAGEMGDTPLASLSLTHVHYVRSPCSYWKLNSDVLLT